MTDRIQITITASNGTKQTFDAIARDSQNVSKSLTQMETSGRRSFDGLSKAVSGIGAAFGTVSVLSLKLAGDAEAANARIENAFQNAGLAIEDYRDRIQALASEGLELGFDDEDVTDTIARFVSTTGDFEAAVNDLSLAQDIARARNIDLAAATNIVAQAEAGRFRGMAQLGIVLDETATKQDYLAAATEKFAGASERYATTGAAQWDRYRNSAENALESLGSRLADVQAPLMALSAGATLLGPLKAGIDAVGGASRLASVALGPVGLVAAAGAAAAAFVLLADHTQEWEHALESAQAATLSLNDAIGQLGAAGQNQIAGPLQDVNQAWADTARNGAMLTKSLADVEVEISNINNRLSNAQPPLTEEQRAEAVASLEALENYRAELERLALSSDQIDAITEDIVSLFQKPGINARKAADDIEWYFQQLQEGRISGEQLVAWIDEASTDWTRYSVNVVLATDAQNAFNLALETAVSTMNAQVRPMQVMMDQARAFADNHVLQAERIATSMAQMQRASVAGLPQPTRTPVALDERDAMRLSAAEGIAQSMARIGGESAANLNQATAAARAYANQLSSLEQSVNAVSNAHATFKVTQDTIISDQSQYTGQLSEYQTQLGYLENAEDLLNQRRAEGIPLTAQQEDFLKRVDDAQARLTGGTEDATLALGDQALQYAENMKIGDEMNDNLKGVNSSVDDLTDAIQDLIAQLQGVPPDTEANVNGSVYNARELSGDTEALHDALTGLDGYGAEAHIAGSVYNASALASSTSDLHSALLALDGTTATTTLNQVVNNITRNTVFRDGGVAGYADGGVLARMAEAGPELLRFADGGVGLALTDGLYSVPRGTLVTPAPASKRALSGLDGGGDVHLHNCTVYVYPETGDVRREFGNALIGMGA